MVFYKLFFNVHVVFPVDKTSKKANHPIQRILWHFRNLGLYF